MMSVHEFAGELAHTLQTRPIPGNIVTEEDLERKFVVPIAVNIAAGHPDIWVCFHPWNNKLRCSPDCEEAHRGAGRVQLGCPKCWSESKNWASVAAFGTHHDFDIVAKDRLGRTLAVEIKLVKSRNGRMPSGEVQRFAGQCVLACSPRHSTLPWSECLHAWEL